MRTRIERLWPLLALALIVAIVLLSFPYLASAYYLEAGGRALDRPEEALELFHRAIAWDSGNAQAFRLLAAAYERQGNRPAAEEAIRRYTELRPHNHLGHFELAEMYDAMAAEVQAEAKESLEAQALQEWQRAGITGRDAIVIGETMERAGQNEAVVWFQRAIALQPEVGDAWHKLGLWYQQREEWADALYAFEQALEVSHFERVSASDPAYYAGLLYHTRFTPPDLSRASRLYDTALVLNQFSTDVKLADCHYRRGEILRIEGHRIEEYITEYELAVSASSNHPWAHARLGYAYYQRDGDVAAAEAELKQALSLAPRNKSMHVMLGDVYRLEGLKDQARAEYEQALEIDPNSPEVHTRLQGMENEQ